MRGLQEATSYVFFVYGGDVSGYDTNGASINATTLIARTLQKNARWQGVVSRHGQHALLTAAERARTFGTVGNHTV